jgi:hypothetical protein
MRSHADLDRVPHPLDFRSMTRLNPATALVRGWVQICTSGAPRPATVLSRGAAISQVRPSEWDKCRSGINIAFAHPIIYASPSGVGTYSSAASRVTGGCAVEDELARLPAGGIILGYDLFMSDRKSRLTITVDPDLTTYAERLVESGHAASVSAAFNEAMAEKAYRDRRRRGLWKAKGDQADPGRVARMMSHVDRQLAGE